MSDSNTDNSERESRLNEVLLGYLEEAQQGRAPERRQLLARHPEFAPELREFFTLRDQIGRLAAPLRDVALSSGITAVKSGSRHGNSDSGSHAPARQESAGAAAPELGQIGEFQLLREIGRGGMGVVYEAHQTSLNRRVALKVLPFASAFDTKQLNRFNNEAQAAAQLHHTNIVPVFGVGHERGVHYYAMQLIDGQSLAALIEELRAHEPVLPIRRPAASNGTSTPADAEPSTVPQPSHSSQVAAYGAETAAANRASFSTDRSIRRTFFFRRVAELARTAANALEHAHQAGVVHRDIKPANLLLDVRGNLWITDFGLAQLQTAAGLTMTGELLGTLRYMSPEQALGRRGQVDHRTDIYSLGVTLYELLTLRPAFDGEDRNELLSQIADHEPVAPRRLDWTIPVELETIVLKAIATEPADRYATAQDMAEDLQRFLEDKPILAKRATLRERGVKWARRHRTIVVSALVTLLLSVAGLSVATVLAARAYDRERQKANEADEQRAKAETSFRQAREAVDEFARISEEELAGNPFSEVARRRLLEAALKYYQDFIRQHRDDPTIQMELEGSRDKASKIMSELTTLAGARHYALLKRKQVQDELRLNEDQRTVLAEIDKGWSEFFRKFDRLPPAEKERGVLTLAQNQEKRIAQLFGRDQLVRFKQIALQSQGPGAFREPEVTAALKLTAGQQASIRAIEADMFSGRPGPFHHGPPPREAGKRFEQSQKAAVAKALAVLTDDQKQRWSRMIGQPFEGAALFCPPERPPGPPPD